MAWWRKIIITSTEGEYNPRRQLQTLTFDDIEVKIVYLETVEMLSNVKSVRETDVRLTACGGWK